MPPLFALVLVVTSATSQAVPRTDTPRGGTLRVTFEPVITTWDREFTASGEQPMGASLPTTVFVRKEQRITPLGLDFGITNRISIGARFPLVRVHTRESFPLDSTGEQPQDSAGAAALQALLRDSVYQFDTIASTPRHLNYFAGDFEVEGKYRIIESHAFALSAALIVRLPTGHQDSPNDLFDISTGNHQTDLEVRVAQELTLFNRLWLNGSVRLGRQQPGERERRIGPQDSLLIPVATLARLNWDPGDYAAFDIAPMYRFSRTFAVGFTAGYYTQDSDRYTFRSTQDSIDVATNNGAPLSASVLDAGTAWRWTRLGVAVTYFAPGVEGSFSVEKTVSGAGGLVPVATVFRVVMRTSRWPF
ncbi:MAG TPA: hypothetical protein VFO67_15540 [Gemmatimonadales bacterium]|nr:hypothetical protein [Gemmatimonadales bacterium]